MSDTILIVDDEESVRRTFSDWLRQSGLNLQVLMAGDAEEALRLANTNPIDLAILDWNLGSGSDGLQLLEDLSVFQPNIAAILVTGYAHQATPLAAMRMGVRDYLDKNHELNRQTFLAAVTRQLAQIGPAKRHRELHASLAAFRDAVEKIVPLVDSAATLNEPVPLPQAVRSLCRFVARSTGSTDVVLLIRQLSSAGESLRAFPMDQPSAEVGSVPFSKSLAAAALSRGEPCSLQGPSSDDAMELRPFERGRKAILAVPIDIGDHGQAVLELFDRPAGYRDEDRRLAAAAAEVVGEQLRQLLADRQARTALLAAVGSALDATQAVTEGSPRPEEPPPAAVLESLQTTLGRGARNSAATVNLAEAIRELAVRFGDPALEHCLKHVQSVRDLLHGME